MNEPIDNILCCVGLRSDCHGVLEQGVRLALATGARLHVMHAVKSLPDDVVHTLRATVRDAEALKGVMGKRVAETRRDLDDKLERFWADHPEQHRAMASRLASVEIVEGYPAKAIVTRADTLGCDLIVVASNKHGFSTYYTGKVTRGVLKRASVPVVVVPCRREGRR